MSGIRVSWVLGLMAVLSVIAGVLAGLPTFFLVAAGATLVTVIGLVWTSLSGLSGTDDMTFEEALSLAAPTVEEEQKRAVLRALKDLEYELRVGKISQEDFEQVSAHYRAEARRLIALSDATLDERRKAAEQRLHDYLDRLDETAASHKGGEDRAEGEGPAVASRQRTEDAHPSQSTASSSEKDIETREVSSS